MAAPGYVAQILNALPADIRTPLTSAFDYVMREFSLGDNAKAENFSWFKVESTTHATANTEFSVPHNMGQVPTCILPVLPLSEVGAQLVPLTVSRAADASRIYLKSSSTGAAVYLLAAVLLRSSYR